MMEELYYIRYDDYIGNALVWWGKGSKGYTSDISQAGKFTLEQATNICKRDKDTAYKCSYIDSLKSARKVIIDCQYVDEKQRMFI